LGNFLLITIFWNFEHYIFLNLI